MLDELAFQLSVTLCCTGETPEPVKDSETVPLVALLTNAKFAEAVPDACGLKATTKEALCPDTRFSGKDSPLTENSLPVMLAEDTATEPLLAVKFAICVRLDPTVTLPKSRAAGVTVSCPALTTVPVPARGTEREGLAALELTASDPFTDPLDVGAKVTLKVKLWPGLKVTGGLMPVKP